MFKSGYAIPPSMSASSSLVTSGNGRIIHPPLNREGIREFWSEAEYRPFANCHAFACNALPANPSPDNNLRWSGPSTGRTSEITSLADFNAAILGGGFKESLFKHDRSRVPEPEAGHYLVGVEIDTSIKNGKRVFSNFHWYRQHEDGEWWEKNGHLMPRRFGIKKNIGNAPHEAVRGAGSRFLGYYHAPMPGTEVAFTPDGAEDVFKYKPFEVEIDDSTGLLIV